MATTDQWGPSYRQLSDPAELAYSPTADGSPLPIIGKAIYVVTDGDLVVKDADGVVVNFGAVKAGAQIAFRARTIESGTTAGLLILH